MSFRSTPNLKAIGAEIFASLDRDRITAAIRDTTTELPDWDWQAVAEMIYTVAEKYLARDVTWMELNAIEYRFEWNSESGVYDMVGQFTAEAPDYLAGKKFVRDWKTTGGALDERWVSRHRDSWQWRVYLYNTDADIMLYTGVNRSGESRECIIHRPANLTTQVRTQLQGLNLAKEGLLTIGAEVYPLSQPHACTSFGRECDYRWDCTEWSMPKARLEGWNWSPSSIDQFQLCPERFRREQLKRIAGVETSKQMSAEIGSAFHRGIAEIYKQVFSL
jgi:hypothetical protein